MAHRFRTLPISIWDTGSHYRTCFNSTQRDLWIYYMTNPGVSVSGIYHTRLKRDAQNWHPAADTLEPPSVEDLQTLLSSMVPLVRYDFDHELIFVRDFLSVNGLKHGRPKLINNAIFRNLEKYPDTTLWVPFIDFYPQYRSSFRYYLQTHSDLQSRLHPEVLRHIVTPLAPTTQTFKVSKFNSNFDPQSISPSPDPSTVTSPPPTQPRKNQATTSRSNNAFPAILKPSCQSLAARAKPAKLLKAILTRREEGGGFGEGYREGGYKGGGEEGNPLGGGEGEHSPSCAGISGLPAVLQDKLRAAVQQSPFDTLAEALATFNNDFDPPRHFRSADLVSDHSLAKQLAQYLVERFNPASHLLEQAGLSTYQIGHITFLMPDLSKRLDYVREKIDIAKQQNPDNPNPTLIYQALLNDYKPPAKIQQPNGLGHKNTQPPDSIPQNQPLPFNHPLLLKAKTTGITPEEQQQFPPHYHHIFVERNGSYFIQA